MPGHGRLSGCWCVKSRFHTQDDGITSRAPRPGPRDHQQRRARWPGISDPAGIRGARPQRYRSSLLYGVAADAARIAQHIAMDALGPAPAILRPVPATIS
jgi:hypothetical protein